MKVEIEMLALECADCGMTFAMPKFINDKLRKCHNTFYCPAGHHNYYPQKSDEEKLKDELRDAKNKLSALQAKEQERLEKQRNRRKNGKKS